MISPLAASVRRHVVTASLSVVLALIPLVCNAGVLAPAHEAAGAATMASHAADSPTSGHHADHAPSDRGVPIDPEFAMTQPGCSPHHGHACCLVAARKPLREDALDAPLAAIAGATCGEGVDVSSARATPLMVSAAPPGPPSLARINAPLLH